jgi:MarR family transcriptional regulator, lower aerobic nicotinate degradation pathway regulator
MKRRDTAISAKNGPPEELPSSPMTHVSHWQPLPESLTRWTGFMLSWLADLAGQEYEQALATIGIQARHLGILTLLEAEGPLVQARIGERLSLVKHMIVALLNDLEAWGLAERRPHPTDKRAFLIHITPDGLQRLQQAEEVSRDFAHTFFAELTPEEQQLFHTFLTRLARSKMEHMTTERN